MQLNSLTKLSAREGKRLGRGLGSGKGKTAGRGQKGQKARGKIPQAVVGGGLILYKKLPFRRGLGNRKVSVKPTLLSLDQLNIFRAKSTVNLDSLIKEGLINDKAAKVGAKILNVGEIKVALSISVPISKGAAQKVIKAGGIIV